ncbi:hypothetical protein OAG71_03120, partial [bacterium]|nr:hypothetical protein [bacterium]
RYDNMKGMTPAKRDELKQKLLAERDQPMKLVKDDEPIVGTLRDAQGNPVVGAKVQLYSTLAVQFNDLTRWKEAASRPDADQNSVRSESSKEIVGSQAMSLVKPSVTDAEGRFRLQGIGDYRLAVLLVSGQGIETKKIHVRTEKGKEIKIRNRWDGEDYEFVTWHPATFNFETAPGGVVNGTVRDAESKEPLAGVTVKGLSRGQKSMPSSRWDFVRAVTDDEGNYRLGGMPIGLETQIAAYVPKGKISYSKNLYKVKPLELQTPLRVDMDLQRGVWVVGQFVDKQTGKGVVGNLNYYIPNENPNADLERSESTIPQAMTSTDSQGRFKIQAYKGIGYLAFRSNETYPKCKAILKSDGALEPVYEQWYETAPSAMQPSFFNLVAEINPAPSQTVLELNLPLDRGNRLTGRVVDPDGNPVENFRCTLPEVVKGTEGKFEIVGYETGTTINASFYDEEGTLAGQLLIEGEQTEDLQVRLLPSASISGRLVDDQGEPIANARIRSFQNKNPALPLDTPNFSRTPYRTDETGRFEISGLVPNVKYTLGAKNVTLSPSVERVMDIEINLKPGEAKEFGDVKSVDVDHGGSMIKGIVFGADKRPVGGAKFYWMASRAYELDPMPPRLIATSDENGAFEFENPKLSLPADAPGRWGYLNWIVVRGPGHGFSMERPGNLLRQMNQQGRDRNAFVHLPASGNPLRGQIVDVDGRPVANATVRIRWFLNETRRQMYGGKISNFKTSTKAQWTSHIDDLINIIEPSQAVDAFPMATTDAKGRFEIQDVGENRLFQLLVQGERIEFANIIARNQPGEKLTVVSDLYRQGDEYTVHPQEILHVAGPSVPVEGRVVDFETGEPVADAMVSANEVHGNNISSTKERNEFRVRTDASGRYRITGLPQGTDNRLTGFSTQDEVPYPILSFLADTSQERDTLQLDFRLKRGVWAEGRVFDSETDAAMTGQIEYYYFRNADLEKDWPGLRRTFVQSRYWTNIDGYFRVPVLPTRGILVYQHDPASHHEAFHPTIDRYPRGAGAESIKDSESKDTGLLRTDPSFLMPEDYNRLVEINPTNKDNVINADMPMTAGRSVMVRPVWPDGKTADEYQAFGAAIIWGWQRQQSPEFEVKGVKKEERRKIFVYDRKRDLVGSAIVSSEDHETVEVKLQPAGTITGRFLDADGTPVTDAELNWRYDPQENQNAAIWAPHPGQSVNPTSIKLDQQGRFQLTGIMPGLSCNADATAPRKMGANMRNFNIGHVFVDVVVDPGEKKDLGDLVLDTSKED